MSGTLRPARSNEIARLWPAVKAARLMPSAEEFSAFRDAGPWRVQVTDEGEAIVLAAWRAHLNVLAIRGLWASAHRVPRLVDAAAAIGRAQGFASVLSPLVPVLELEPYRRAGMRELERLVALQAEAAEIARQPADPAGIRVRVAVVGDVPALAVLDSACFEGFWRYGEPELRDALERERVLLAEDASGAILGYATCARYGASATLGRLAVAPIARRRGIAAALCTCAARWARDGGAYTMTLCTQEANEGSRSLYSAMRFTELGARFALGIREETMSRE